MRTRRNLLFSGKIWSRMGKISRSIAILCCIITVTLVLLGTFVHNSPDHTNLTPSHRCESVLPSSKDNIEYNHLRRELDRLKGSYDTLQAQYESSLKRPGEEKPVSEGIPDKMILPQSLLMERHRKEKADFEAFWAKSQARLKEWAAKYDADKLAGAPSKKHSRRKSDKNFVSKKVESLISEYKKKIKDKDIAHLFENCYPNTLDTTVKFTASNEKDNNMPDSFVITGDINAMWLRDSTNQVFPYIRFVNEDEDIKQLIIGLIRRQTSQVLLDPYANAFLPAENARGWAGDRTRMVGGVHERKYELDSLASTLRLAAKYFEESRGDTTPFDSKWREGVSRVLDTIVTQMEPSSSEYTFARNSPHPTETILLGRGPGGRKCGLSKSHFRPSDDSSVFPFPIAANAMTVVSLRKLIRSGLLNADPALASRASKVCTEMELALEGYGIVKHPIFGDIYAYEVDCAGSVLMGDDANIPSLLSLPYLEYVEKNNTIYQNTRKLLLSHYNPWFFSGNAAEGIGSPHAHGWDYIWPMSIIMRALTSDDDMEIKACLYLLKSTDGNAGYMHETFHKDQPSRFTRAWFAWANTLFGELIVVLAEERPHILF